MLDVDDAEDEDELVEDEVPELVLELGLLGDSQLAEHALLDGLAQQHQQAVGHVDQRLQQGGREWRQCWGRDNTPAHRMRNK